MNTYPRARSSVQLVRPASVRPIAMSGSAAGKRAATNVERSVAWRDVIQSYAHDVAETPIISRMLAAQVVLALGGASLYAARALRRRIHSATNHPRAERPAEPVHHDGHPFLIGAMVAGGLALVWAALAFISRTRAAPAVTAIFVYGSALRRYFPPLTRAA